MWKRIKYGQRQDRWVWKRFTSAKHNNDDWAGSGTYFSTHLSITKVKFLDSFRITNVLKTHGWKVWLLAVKGWLYICPGGGVILTTIYSFSRIVEKRRQIISHLRAPAERKWLAYFRMYSLRAIEHLFLLLSILLSFWVKRCAGSAPTHSHQGENGLERHSGAA